MAKSKKPSGLTLTRDEERFAAKWKIAARDYDDGLACQRRTTYKIKKTVKKKKTTVTAESKWAPLKVKNNRITSIAFQEPLSNWHPYTNKKLAKVSFRVRGNEKEYEKGSGRNKEKINKTVSDWSTKDFKIHAPKKPDIDINLGTWPSATARITVKTDDSDHYTYSRMQYTSVLLEESTITDGKDVDWSEQRGRISGTDTDDTKNVSITEDSGLLNNGKSYTRWVRARAQGPGGDSKWAYAYHTYAYPIAPEIVTDSVLVNEDAATGRTYTRMSFETTYNIARPVNEIRAEWYIGEPAANLQPPSGASWEAGATVKPKDDSSGAIFNFNGTVGEDQCLWLRAVAVYGEFETPGEIYLAKAGTLATPTGLSATPGDNHTFTASATNASGVPGSYLVVRYYDAENPDGLDVGILDTSPKVIICPAYETSSRVAIGVYAAVGDYETTTRADGVTVYDVSAEMKSAVQKSGGSVPLAPANVTAQQIEPAGTIRVTWDWSWEDADSAELSWADHEDAWESTDEPTTYTVTKARASAWNISGLELGKIWYVRVRLIKGTDDSASYGAYAIAEPVNLSSAPLTPFLELSDSIITAGGEVTASWIYTTTDGTRQIGATIAEIINNAPVTIGQTTTQQSYTISAENWQSGETHMITVKVMSASGVESGWSPAVPVAVAEPVTCTIDQSSLVSSTIETEDEDEEPVIIDVMALTALPLTVTITGAGDSGTTDLIIERAETYEVERPDETAFNVFEGETVVAEEQTGDDQITVELTDVFGSLDDGAFYNLIASVTDGLGQKDEKEIKFVVQWAHQAGEPTAAVEIDDEKKVAFLTPIAPQGAQQGDVCDIYRLSIDKPELIYRGATFGTKYVDPYPTIGEYGGHRFVTRTSDGDYTTADQKFAIYDTGAAEGDIVTARYNIIDFGDGQAHLTYDCEISSEWQKDFEQTAYLGGSVEGDWNRAVRKSGTVTGTGVEAINQDLAQVMRRLAEHAGICHVRTKDGSSYAADVQVGEQYVYATGVTQRKYSLKINRVEPETLDGLTYEEWLETEGE